MPTMSSIFFLSLQLSDPTDPIPNLSTSELTPIVVQRCPVTHLFHFHPLLCETITVQEQHAGSVELDKDSGASEMRRFNIGVSLRSKVEAVEVDSRQLQEIV